MRNIYVFLSFVLFFSNALYGKPVNVNKEKETKADPRAAAMLAENERIKKQIAAEEAKIKASLAAEKLTSNLTNCKEVTKKAALCTPQKIKKLRSKIEKDACQQVLKAQAQCKKAAGVSTAGKTKSQTAQLEELSLGNATRLPGECRIDTDDMSYEVVKDCKRTYCDVANVDPNALSGQELKLCKGIQYRLCEDQAEEGSKANLEQTGPEFQLCQQLEQEEKWNEDPSFWEELKDQLPMMATSIGLFAVGGKLLDTGGGALKSGWAATKRGATALKEKASSLFGKRTTMQSAEDIATGGSAKAAKATVKAVASQAEETIIRKALAGEALDEAGEAVLKKALKGDFGEEAAERVAKGLANREVHDEVATRIAQSIARREISEELAGKALAGDLGPLVKFTTKNTSEVIAKGFAKLGTKQVVGLGV